MSFLFYTSKGNQTNFLFIKSIPLSSIAFKISPNKRSPDLNHKTMSITTENHRYLRKAVAARNK